MVLIHRLNVYKRPKFWGTYKKTHRYIDIKKTHRYIDIKLTPLGKPTAFKFFTDKDYISKLHLVQFETHQK